MASCACCASPHLTQGTGCIPVEELQLLIVQSHQAGILEDIERHLMQRSTQFADLRVADVMIPRLDIVAVDLARPPDDVLGVCAEYV
jgi:putative hemolysin